MIKIKTQYFTSIFCNKKKRFFKTVFSITVRFTSQILYFNLSLDLLLSIILGKRVEIVVARWRMRTGDFLGNLLLNGLDRNLINVRWVRQNTWDDIADANCRTLLWLWSLRRLLAPTSRDLPEPWLVVDHLNLLSVSESFEDSHRLARTSVPLARSKVNESTLVSSTGDHINTINISPAAGDHRLLDATPANIVENAWDTQANAGFRVAVCDCVGRN